MSGRTHIAASGTSSMALPALRVLRAPLAALCALLVVLMAVPTASADGSICVGWPVGEPDDAAQEDVADCPFCSASVLAPPPVDGATAPVERFVVTAPPRRTTPRAARARAPPLGPRAPPLA